MQSELLFQPYQDETSLHAVLAAALDNPQYDSLSVVVAWARRSGLGRLTEQLRRFHDRGGGSRIIVGIDEGGATQEGLTLAVEEFSEAWVVHDASGGTFHPKLYFFEGQSQSLLAIGSNNLTAGGLYFNYEVAHVALLDHGLPHDLNLTHRVRDYIARLVDDDVCRTLDSDLIALLGADPRYMVSETERDRRRRRREDDPTAADADDFGPPLFGSTKYPRNTAPPLGGRTPGVTARTNAVLLADQAVEEGGSTADAVARWNKRLTRSDSGQPRPGSQTTAALRFTKSGQPINQSTWFRQVLFRDADWDPDSTRVGRERATVRFDVWIDGVARGTHALTLKYDAAREAGQANFTTDLKWGPLSPVLRQTDLVGQFISVERLADGTYRMTIADQAVGDFIDDLPN